MNESLSSTEEHIDIQQLVKTSCKYKRLVGSSMRNCLKKNEFYRKSSVKNKSNNNTIGHDQSNSMDNPVQPLSSIKRQKDQNCKSSKDQNNITIFPLFKNSKNRKEEKIIPKFIYMSNPIIIKFLRSQKDSKCSKEVSNINKENKDSLFPDNSKSPPHGKTNNQSQLTSAKRGSKIKKSFDKVNSHSFLNLPNKKMLVPYLQNPHGYKKLERKLKAQSNNSMIPIKAKKLKNNQQNISPINFYIRKRPQTTTKRNNRQGFSLSNPLSKIRKMQSKPDDENIPKLINISQIPYNNVADLKFDHHFLVSKSQRNSNHLVLPLKYYIKK